MLAAIEYRKSQHPWMLGGFHDEYGLVERAA
jgi:hypothetical protein